MNLDENNKSLFPEQSESISKNVIDDQERERLRLALCDARIYSYSEVPVQENALEVDGRGFLALNELHALKAKQKSGKTTILKVLVAALLLGVIFRVKSLLVNPRILFFDTEQSKADTKLILEDVAQMTGVTPELIDSQVALYSLRRRDREELLPMLRVAIEDEKPSVVFIDGLVDFVSSFNDETASKQLIHELLVLCDEFNCAIVCVLHTNKAEDDHNMRGHLGTMMCQKSSTVLECTKTKGVITVSCTDARHAEMPQWSIMYGEDGHIVDADERYKQLLEQRKAEQENKRKEASAEMKRERLEKCLTILRDNGGSISRKQLTEQLVIEFKLERCTVSSYISEWLKDKVLVKVDDMIQVNENQALPF